LLVAQAIPFRGTNSVQLNQEPFNERPAQKFLENLPATTNPPPAKTRATSISALQEPLVTSAVTWTARGPFPIPNGQTETREDPVSGRVTAITVHPTNPTIVYVGTAQGGLYRTLDGGSTWTQLMD